MAADIYGYAGRELAWHRIGAVKQDASTMMELHQLAGMDYTYQLVPIFWEKEQGEDTYHIAEKGKRLVTMNGETSLGHIVSHDYQYHQPHEIAQAIDEILTASKEWGTNWLPETAVALGKGDTTCYCISLGNTRIGKSEYMPYFIVTDTIDGKHALVSAVVYVRVVCRNTLRMALAGAEVSLSIRHTTGHRESFKNTVENIIKSKGYVFDTLQRLSDQAVNEEYVNNYLDKLFEIPDVEDDRRSPTVVKKMSALQLSAQGNFYRMVEQEKELPTKLTLFNAAQETIEHSGLVMREKTTVKSLLTGNGEVVNKITEAYKLLV